MAKATADTILISGAGGAATPNIIRILRQECGYRVVAIDANPNAQYVVDADAFYAVPRGDAPGFIPTLADIIERERCQWLVPLVDEEVLAFHHVAPLTGAWVVAPMRAFCLMALDKWLTAQRLTEAALPAPKSWLGTQISQVEYPAIAKPRIGHGSRGFARIPNNKILLTHLIGEDLNGTIIQECLKGTEYTVSVVVGHDGTVLAVVPKEVIEKRGITMVGITRENYGIDILCRAIQDRLKANGPFNVQLIVGEDGIPRIFEINPRLSTTSILTMAAGVNEIDLFIRHAKGEDVGQSKFKADLRMVRHYNHRFEEVF